MHKYVSLFRFGLLSTIAAMLMANPSARAESYTLPGESSKPSADEFYWHAWAGGNLLWTFASRRTSPSEGYARPVSRSAIWRSERICLGENRRRKDA